MMAGVAAPALSATILGATAGPLTQAVDARWLMAYAAAVGENDPRYFDTAAPNGPLAHPLFAVCYEWPVAMTLREGVIGPAIAPRSVHATHHVRILRAPRAGDVLTTTARVVGLARRPAGALVTLQLDTVDADGCPVTTTRHGSVYRGVKLDEEAGEPPRRAAAGEGAVRWEAGLVIAPHAAHVYTECARIWNPIHTDLAVARAAGLPGPILHGTATLAMAVSQVVARDLAGDPPRVREVTARFTGKVEMPSRLTVRGWQHSAGHFAFDVIDERGEPVLTGGVLGS